MDWLAAVLSDLSDWWAGLPPVPDLGLPDPGDAAVLTVVATVVSGLGVTGLFSGWAERRFSVISLGSLILGLVLFFWIWEVNREAFDWLSVPEAFVEMVARVLR
ncbi:hypothetical protein [Jannaschia pohangensis]|uniref:Uncharacterized protein n=1 Tax=Jannaschia pohangensis TaxID=390807 RepID=A0A1I3NIQ6_9RHOB|nr:hypothetical protein [Jannaschia pohangensis]SFJ09057.1 hypothetical protein SAMN04488095_2165 [Jannaschia pohangensis]